MVEQSLVVQWIVGTIPHGGPIDLFLISRSSQYFTTLQHGKIIDTPPSLPPTTTPQ